MASGERLQGWGGRVGRGAGVVLMVVVVVGVVVICVVDVGSGLGLSSGAPNHRKYAVLKHHTECQ